MLYKLVAGFILVAFVASVEIEYPTESPDDDFVTVKIELDDVFTNREELITDKSKKEKDDDDDADDEEEKEDVWDGEEEEEEEDDEEDGDDEEGDEEEDLFQVKHGRQPGYSRTRPPHIILVLGDDIGHNDVGWNNDKIHTPYMNKMAKEGVILDNFYALPLCTPSRATLLSGLYAQQLGLQRGVLMPQEPYGIPLKYKLISDRLKGRGYRTHAFGKWHLGFCDWRYTPTQRGFDTFLGFYQGGEENYEHCLSEDYIYDPISNCSQFDFRNNKQPAPQFNGDYSSYVYGEGAEEVIHQHKRFYSKKPLFMYFAISSTHFPVQGDKFVSECQNENKARREFCGAMASVDQAFENITEALKKNNMYNNSVIIFISDNGGSTHFGGNNFPLRGNKGTLYEGGTRVPGFIHSPLLKKTGYKHQGIVHIVDWYTTFLHLAGLRRTRNLNGVNQWFALSENKTSPRTEFPYSMDIINGTVIGAVRVGDYKLIGGPGGTSDQWYTEKETTDESYNSTFLIQYTSGPLPFNLSDTSVKLYNLKTDPYEKNNIADSEPAKLKELEERFDFYFGIAAPAVKMAEDPAGDPEKFGGVFSPGWCKAYYDVPTERKKYMNQNKVPPYLN